jgi:predicted ribosome quality control (RQC) complex YloA/Tae2 family protein
MSFGPELIWYTAEYLEKYTSRRVYKIDGGDSWITITLAGNLLLLLSWGTRSCGAAVINESDKRSLLSSSKQTPPIINILKSQLGGSEFTSIKQIRRDRIIKLEFKKTVGAGFTNTRHLILEAMERYSNLVITDENNIVIETAKHIHPSDNMYRSVLPGQVYIMPPEFTGISLEQWLSSPDMSTLKNVAGFGKKFIKILSAQDLNFCTKHLADFYLCDNINRMIPQCIENYMTIFPVVLPAAKTFSDTCEFGRSAVLDPIISVDTNQERKKILNYIKHEITRRERQTEDINNSAAQRKDRRLSTSG